MSAGICSRASVAAQKVPLTNSPSRTVAPILRMQTSAIDGRMRTETGLTQITPSRFWAMSLIGIHDSAEVSGGPAVSSTE